MSPGAGPALGPVQEDIRNSATPTSSLSRAPQPKRQRVCPPSLPLRQHPEYKGYQPQVPRTCPAPLTRASPRRLSHPRGSYLGRDCRLAEEDRGRAGWRGGAAAYEAQGFRVGVPAGAALVRATVPSGDFGAAPASKRGGEGPGRPS